jgi:hypothetical protein
MKNNIGIFSTHALWPSHFETDLELIQQEVDFGNKVIVISCDSCIEQCELIWNKTVRHNKSSEELRVNMCKTCQTKQFTGLSLIKGDFQKESLITKEEQLKTYPINESYLANSTTLKQLVIDEHYLVGWAMLSSIISCYREPFIDVITYKTELSKLYQDCSRVYYSTKAYITKHQLQKLYVFSGRLSYTRAVLDAAKAMGVDCFVHERASDFTKYSLFKNHTVHNLTKLTECIHEHWNSEKDHELKNKLGSQFYIDRENNIIGSWSTFLDLQDPSLLPSNWDKQKHNIALFTSSEDEFMSISPEWDNPFFKSQLVGLNFVANLISKQANMHLYIRVHPNTKLMAKDYIESLYKIREYSNVTLIEFDSNISSYQLLKSSNKIITFGSTMGMEAVYWKKPTILLGKTLYSYLKGPTYPKDVNEIEALILNENLPLATEDEAVKFGYFFRTYGNLFKHYKPLDYKSGTFKGVDLNNIQHKDWVKPNLLLRIKNKVIKTLKNK